MKAEDLRLGNWVICERLGVCDTLHILQQIKNFDQLIKFEQGHINYEPIPLTEEWLLKFGFEKMCCDYDLNWFSVRVLRNGEIYLNANDGNLKSIKIPYVHTLQNLHYAIVGKELTINGQ